MSKRELSNLAEDFDFDGAHKRAKNEEYGDEELRCFSFSANEMYNKMKGLDASSPPTFIPHTAEQTLLEGKICDKRKHRSDKKRRIAATVNPKLPLPVPMPTKMYYLA